ncbi:MAG: hypothetical protein V3S68_02265, partial [Dehalococcoidia bacterium]
DAVGGGLLILASFLTMELGFRRRFFLPVILSRARNVLRRTKPPERADVEPADRKPSIAH